MNRTEYGAGFSRFDAACLAALLRIILVLVGDDKQGPIIDTKRAGNRLMTVEDSTPIDFRVYGRGFRSDGWLLCV